MRLVYWAKDQTIDGSDALAVSEGAGCKSRQTLLSCRGLPNRTSSNGGKILAFLFLPLPQPYPGATAVLVDELDAEAAERLYEWQLRRPDTETSTL